MKSSTFVFVSDDTVSEAKQAFRERYGQIASEPILGGGESQKQLVVKSRKRRRCSFGAKRLPFEAAEERLAQTPAYRFLCPLRAVAPLMLVTIAIKLHETYLSREETRHRGSYCGFWAEL